MPIISTAVAIGIGIAAAGVAIGALVASATSVDTGLDTSTLDASRQVQRQLDRALPREVVVGTTMTGGVGAFNDAYGPNNEYGVAVTVLSSVPITGFDTLVVDGDRMTLSGDPTLGWTYVSSHYLGSAGSMDLFWGVTLPTEAPRPRLSCRVWLGDDNTALGVWLNSKFPSKFATTDMYKGCAVLVTVAENTNDDISDEGENEIPFQGFPVVQSIVQGVAVCDPRNGGVYGDTSTYAYSENAGLIEAQLDFGFYGGVAGDKLLVGNGFTVGLLSLPQIAKTADYCDLRGYACSGRIRSASQDDITEVRKCFNGVRVQSPAGVMTIPQGGRPPAVTIDMALYPYASVEDANRQGYSADVYNKARTLYREPSELYGKKDLPIFSVQTWIDEDNGVPRQKDIELKLVPDSAQAAKLQDEIMYMGRAAGSVVIENLPAHFSSGRVMPNACLVTLENARPLWLNNTVFTLETKRRASNFDVDISLREYAGDAVFAEHENAPATVGTITPIPTRVWTQRVTTALAPGVGASLVRQFDGVITIDDIDLTGIGSTATELASISGNINAVAGAGGGIIVSLDKTTVRYTRTGTYTGSGSTVTTDTVTASTTGGSGVYSSHLWEVISGDAFTVNNAATPAASFSIFLGEGDFRSAQARYTVTDDNGGVTTKTISVTASDNSRNYEDLR